MAETNPFADPNYGLEPGAQENPFSNPDYGKDTDGPLARGWKKSKQSIAISRDLTTGDVDSAAQNIAEAERYARANPGLPEGRELSQAWDRGEGISGGVKEVAGEIKKDWDESSNWVGGLRATGRNLRAMGEGVIEQVPNMVAPVTGMLAGGFAGAKVGGALGSVVPGAGTAAGAAVGGVAGGWAGASAGNAAIEGGYMAQEALQKAGIDPQDTQAVRRFLLERGDSIMGDAAVKGGIIGAVDVATLRLGSLLLTGPGRAATSRALADMGVDAADKAAVKAAMETPQFAQRIAGDTAYQASRTGAQNVARNVGAAALDPAGEFAGEYLGQGVATGEWDAKNAALEAFSSIGQSGAMFAGQKAYQYVTRPRSAQGEQTPPEAGTAPPAGPQGFAPAAERPVIDESALGRAGIFPPAPAPIINERALEPTAPTPSQQMGLDPAAGPMSAAAALAVDTGASAAMQQAAQAVEPAPAIDVSGRTDDQLRVLEQSGRDGWREAAVAEIQRRAAQQPAEAPASAVEPAAQAAVEQQAPAAPAPSIKDVLAKQIPDMTDGELRQAIDHYGPSNKRTAKLLKEVQRRSQGAPAAAVQPTQAPTALEQSRPAPSPRSESAQQSEAADPAEEVRRQLREVETRILAAAPNAMGAGGGDIEAAMKSRKVPVTLKAQRKRLKEQLRQASQGEQAQNVQPAQVDAASGQGSGAIPAGSAGNAPSGPVVLDGVRRPAGAPAPSSAAGIPVGEPVVQQPAGVEARQKLAGLQAFAQQVGSNVSADEISALPEQESARLYDMIVDARRLNQEVGSEWTQAAQNWIEGAVRSSIASQALGNRVEGMKERAKQFAEQSAAERAAREARKKGAPTQSVPPTQQVAPQAQEAGGKEGEKTFAPETGTLGIPRAEMPQVPSKSHGGLVKHLNAQGIAHETTSVDAASLTPTQAEYSPEKVEAAKTAAGDRAVIVSSDGHIVDGHHQALAAAEQGKQVKAIVLDAPIDQALEAVKNSPSAQAATPASGPRSESAQPGAEPPEVLEFTTLKDRDGKTVTVRTADLSSTRERMPTFTKEGKRRTAWIHRDNLDPTGEKQAEGAKEMANNPLFNVITTKDGGAFASEGAAERELRRRGLQETHEVVPASEVSDGINGFVVRRTKAAAPAEAVEQQQPDAAVPAWRTVTGTPFADEAGAVLALMNAAQKPSQSEEVEKAARALARSAEESGDATARGIATFIADNALEALASHKINAGRGSVVEKARHKKLKDGIERLRSLEVERVTRGDEKPATAVTQATHKDPGQPAELAQQQEKAADTQAAAERTEYPFGEVPTNQESKFFRSRVRVLPEMRGDTAWDGEVGSILNGGRLLEVTRDGQDFSVRVRGERIEVLERVENGIKESEVKLDASVHDRWSSIVAATNEESRAQRSVQALARFAGATGEPVNDVWGRWRDFIGATELAGRTGEQVVRWMESNLISEPWNDRAIPGNDVNGSMGSTPDYWRSKLADYERAMTAFNEADARMDQQTFDVERVDGSPERTKAAREILSGMRKKAAENGEYIRKKAQEAEKNEAEETARAEEDRLSRFKPFDAGLASKKPSVASITGWFAGTWSNGANTAWSDGSIADLYGEPHLKGWETRKDNKRTTPDVDRVIPRNSNDPLEPVGMYDGKVGQTKGVMYYQMGDNVLPFALHYVQYFMSKYKGAKLVGNLSTPTGPAAVVHEGRTVGVIMPMRVNQVTAEELRENIAKGEKITQQREKADPTAQERTEQPAAGRAIADAEREQEFVHNGVRIYPTTVNVGGERKAMWGVESAENKAKREAGDRHGFGDSLFDTQEQARAAADRQIKDDAARAEFERRKTEIEAEKQAEAAARKADTINGFLDGKAPNTQELIRKALDKQYRFDGVIRSVREQVEWLDENGTLEVGSFDEPKIKPLSRTQFNRATQREQDAHEKKMREAGTKTVYLVSGSEIGKYAYDYAQHLIARKSSSTAAETPAQPPAANQPALTGPRRNPAQVSAFAPYAAGDIVTIDGKDWQVQQDMGGWYLTSTGNWRGMHPTIQKIRGMNELIAEIERAATAQPDAAAEQGETPADAEAPADDLLTPDQARALMTWEDLGQRDNVKSMRLAFFESAERMAAKRGAMNYGTIESYQGGKWNIDGTTYPTLKAAKAAAEDAALVRLANDGYVAQPFAAYDAVARTYGYEVRADGAIGSEGKFPGPTIKEKGGRLRVESSKGDLLGSYPATPESLGRFLESFWGAEKQAAQPASGQPTSDRDQFTVERVDEDQRQTLTFKRGETVKVSGKYPMETGQIDGISNARKEFRIGGAWLPFGYAYKAEYDEFAAPRRELEEMIANAEKRIADGNGFQRDGYPIRDAREHAKRYGLEGYDDTLNDLAKRGQAAFDRRIAEDRARMAAAEQTDRERREAADAADAAKYAGPVKMTMDEWKRIGRDFKSFNGGNRTVMQDGRIRRVEIVKEKEGAAPTDAPADVVVDRAAQSATANPLRNADGTFARQDPAGDSLAFSATLPRDRNAVRIGITEKGLVRAMRLQFDGLADVTSKLLERGRAGKRGGVIVVSTADNAEIGRIVAERTGRKLDSTMRKFSSAGRLNGFYDPKIGLTFLVAPNLNPVTATAVMLHEMMHGQQRQKIDARALEMVRNRHGLKDEGLRAFLDRVMLRMIKAGEVGNAAEASAYIVEQAVIEGRSAGYTFADNAFMQWVDAKIGKRVGDFLRSFAGMIRTWLLRNGLGAKTMTVDDFVGYAMAGLDRAAAGEVRGRASSRASIDAWHGSPYRFDRFDLGNVGMGEGAQAYGWGLYFAGSREVAEHYKSKLAKAELFINGERSVLDYNDPAGNMARQEVLDAANAGIKDAVGYALLQNYVYPGVLERLQYWHENGIAEVRKGALYKVSIAPDEDTFLLWDKPLSEQPKKVTQGLRSAIDAMFGNGTFDAYAAAGNDWRDMKDNLLENTSEKDVSLMMKANGIAGVKYLDGMSRDGSGGSFNYVVFDDADVEIDEMLFSRASQTASKAFRKWFAGSKVVDESGAPLVVYHGTNSDLSVFASDRANYFTADPGAASIYAEGFGAQREGANVYPVYLSIQRPKWMPLTDSAKLTAADLAAIKEEGFDGVFGWTLDTGMGGPTPIAREVGTGQRGMDKIVTEAIPLSSEQVKSAVGNNGDYDPDNDNILFSRSVGDAPSQEAQRVQSAVEGKTLIEAAQFMTRSKDGAKAAVAQKVLEKLQRLEKAGVVLDLKIVHRGDMAPASMVNARGYTETGFDEKGRDIVVWLNGADVTGKVGTEEEVLLHELVHAATAGMVFYGTQTPNSLAGKHARDLMAVTDAIAEHIRKRFDAADAGKATLTEFEQDMRDGANNAFRSDDEVLAWALSNSEAQAYLETIPYRSGSMWSNFVQAVRNLLGLSARNDTALSEVLRVAERILTDDAPNAGRAAFWHKRNIRMAQQQVRGSIAQTAERGADDLQFSRSGLENAQQAARNIGAGLKAITVQDVKKAGKHKLTDWLKLGLQFLGRRQIVDVYGDVLPLAEYDRLAAQMEADKNDVGAAADELARRWGKLPDEGKLADLMHDATLAQIDADSAVEYVPGDDLATSRALKAQFGQLSGEAQKVYREARDHYRKHHAAVRQAIIDRIMRSELREDRRAELLQRMDADFFKSIKGVYFPLSRFGQYVVVTKDDAGKVVSVSRAETMAEAEAMRAEMVKAFPARDGYQVGRVTLSKEFIAGRDMVGRGFMTELYEALDEQGLDPSVQAELEDTLGQLYLSSLPDLSWAKHGIHRKGTPGFSSDARRAFAQNTFHGARYLAKLKYGDQMQAELDRMQKHVDEMAPIEGFDQPAAQRVVDEMNKRHEATMNPKGNPLSTALTSFGFVYYLGISPAAAVVNLSQTPLVAYPVMGAKWGFRKAGAALMAASAEVVEGKNDLRAVLADRLKNEQDPKAKRKHQDEIAAYDEAVRTGVIDVTMAHDLAGIAQGEDAKVMWKIRPVMRLASYLFHHAERFNRQATFLASYRLARDAGAKHDDAYSQAVKATYDGHFDYSTGNRPRVMQGNVAKVVLLFKQYAQNMIFTIARNAYQSVKGESPEVRREARKVFGALMTMHAAAAGVLGLPMVGTLLTLASALGGSDDEPWDAEVALRNMLADTFGTKPAEVIAKGFSRLTPWDISGRVDLDGLLMPDVNESLEGQRWAESFATTMLGPVIGIGVNVSKGAQKMADGDYLRGLEDMLPIAVRNGFKAARQYREGEVDRTGVVIKDEVSLAGVLGQASGFSPSEIRLAFEGRSAVMSADRRLAERRQDLMTQFARAAMDQDQDGMTEARAAIADFNKVNPGRRITPPQMWQSVRNRERRIREADEGVYLPRTRRDVMDEGRFAEVG